MKKHLVLVVLLLGFGFAINTTSLNSSATSIATESVDIAIQTCIDLNNASFDKLQGITHIGIDEAIAILRFRNVVDFRFTNDLIYISGINVTELGEIKAEGLACVSPVMQ